MAKQNATDQETKPKGSAKQESPTGKNAGEASGQEHDGKTDNSPENVENSDKTGNNPQTVANDDQAGAIESAIKGEELNLNPETRKYLEELGAKLMERIKEGDITAMIEMGRAIKYAIQHTSVYSEELDEVRDFPPYEPPVKTEIVATFGKDIWLTLHSAEANYIRQSTSAFQTKLGSTIKTVTEHLAMDEGTTNYSTETLVFVPGAKVVEDRNEQGELIGRRLI